MQRFLMFSMILGLALAVPGIADEKKDEGKKGQKEFKATCPVSGKDAVRDQSVAYKEKKVYFCCGNCKAAYEKEPTKFTNKANWQLAQTRQYVQTKCPLSGGAINKEQTTEIGGVKVSFCCGDCKGKAAAATGDGQAQNKKKKAE